jgi:type III pantothenate kinase
VLGRNTVHAMQSGLVLGHIAMVEGLIARVVAEFGRHEVVATGGLAPTLAAHTDVFDVVDPLLTLEGLRLIAERNP